MGVSDEAGIAAEEVFILNAECVVTRLEGIAPVVGQRVPQGRILGSRFFVGGGDFPLLSGCMETFNNAKSTEAFALRCCLGRLRRHMPFPAEREHVPGRPPERACSSHGVKCARKVGLPCEPRAVWNAGKGVSGGIQGVRGLMPSGSAVGGAAMADPDERMRSTSCRTS